MVESAKLNPEKVTQFFEKEFQSNILPNLMEYIKIPNLSKAYVYTYFIYNKKLIKLPKKNN